MAGYVIATVEVTKAEYTPLRPIRQANSSARIAFFEGIAKGTGQSGALNLG